MDTFIKAEQDEMLKAITEICKDNGVRITKELSDKYIRKSSKEYKALEDSAGRADLLARENARLLEESKGLLEGYQRLERSDRENERLAEGLSRLEKELEQMEGKGVRCEGVERENVELRRERQKLEKELDERMMMDATKPPQASSAKGTVLSEISMEVEISGKGYSVERYNTLVNKYNDLYTRYDEMNAARKKLEEKLRQNIAKHNKQEESLTSAVANRDHVIEAKRETIRKLRAKLANVSGSSGNADGEVEPALERKRGVFKYVERGHPIKDEENADGRVAVPLIEYSRRTSKPIEPVADSPKANIQASQPNLSLSLENQSYGSTSSTTNILAVLSPTVSTASHNAHFGFSDVFQEPPNLLREGKFHAEDAQSEAPKLTPLDVKDEEELPCLPLPASEAVNGDIWEMPESESPEIIDVRAVRKWRKRAHEEEEPARVKKIKVELLSSSPIGITALTRLEQGDRFDLDEIGDKVDTPKKKRQQLIELQRQASKLSKGSQESNGNGTQLQSYPNKSPLSHPTIPNEQLRFEGQQRGSPLQQLDQNQQILPRLCLLQSRDHNQQILPRTSKLSTPKTRRLANDRGIAGISEDVPDELPSHKTTPHNVNPTRLGDLLARPSPPRRALSPARKHSTNHFIVEERSATSVLSRNVMSLNAQSPGVPTEIPVSKKALEPRVPQQAWTEPSKKSIMGDGLRGLFGTSQPRADVGTHVSRLSRTPNADTPSVKRASRPVEARPEDESRTTLLRTHASPGLSAKKRQPANKKKNNDEVDPDSEPLRIRPYETLKLSDFKINQNYNQGIAFAFNDVVRGRDARRCLQGCTKPECCGKQFRSLASMMRDNKRTDQDEVDQKLLEEFMGDNAFKIPYLSPGNREELILQAMTRDFANNYGRHRHAYERRRSPPGFWDADFPTTQEQQEARREELKREEEEIAKRYEEAMRPRGRYIFRDE